MRPDKRPFGVTMSRMVEIPMESATAELAGIEVFKSHEVQTDLRRSVCAVCIDCPRFKIAVSTYQDAERYRTVVRGEARCTAMTGLIGCPDGYDPMSEKWIVKQETPAYWEEVPKTPVVVHTEEPPADSWGHLSGEEIKEFMREAKILMAKKGFGAVSDPELLRQNIDKIAKQLYHNSLDVKKVSPVVNTKAEFSMSVSEPVTEKVKKSLDEAFDRPSQDLPTTEGSGSW